MVLEEARLHRLFHPKLERPVFVEGRLRLDSWETQDGQKRNKLKVVCENFEFIGGRQNAGGGGSRRQDAAADQGRPAPGPAQAPAPDAPPPDDDIPF